LKQHHAISLSHETIYRFIYGDAIRHAQLKPFLRQGGKRRRKRYGSGARASGIPHRVSIEERPHVVEKNARIGDWECDTVIGKDRKSVLVTVVDRASLYTVCSRVLSRSARVVCAAIIRLLRPFKARVKTLTFDNGSEFVRHETIARPWRPRRTLPIRIAHGSAGSMKMPTACCANFSPSRQILGPCPGNRYTRLWIISIIVQGKLEGIEPPTNSFTITSSRWWRNNCTYYLNSRRLFGALHR